MTARTKVAVVTDSIYPYHRGGKEIRYHELLKRLSRTADVHVYTMKWWSGPAVHELDGVTYHAISRNVPLYAKGRRSLVQAAWFALACTQLVREPFDVIEADHIPYAPVYVLRAVSWLRRKRLVVTWHEVWGKEAWIAYLGRPGRIAWLIERGAMRLPDEIIAASTQTADRLSAEAGGHTRISVAPNGLDLEAIRRATPSPDRSNLVFVGRLLGHKGVDVLIDAVAVLARRGKPVSCRVVGQGPELVSLRERARTRRVDQLVEFRDDVVDQDELYSLVKSADVFVFPSTREGFGIAVLEAIACGLPVITSNHPDNLARYLIDSPERGVVCEPTADSLADAIESLLAAQRSCEPTSSALSMATKTSTGRVADLSAYDWAKVALVVEDALGVPHG